VGKKIPAEMAAQKEKLIKGIIMNGQTPEFAEKLWKLFEPFQAYGFGKAHAASYGKVAYQTAYMKANYPVEYMTAILTAESGDVEKISEIIAECKKMKIEVLPPSVNESFGGFTVINHEEKDSKRGVIRFGLYTIKNLGTDISNAIIDERKARGNFTTIGDFLDRVTHKNLNKKSLEALIKSGAMDDLGERGNLYGNIEGMLEYNKEAKKVNVAQDSLFGGMPISSSSFELKEVLEIGKEEKLIWEKELLGLYISGHPLDKIKDKLEGRPYNIKKIIQEGRSETEVTIAGIIDTVRLVMTKKNDRMAFIKISDLSGSIEAVIFPKLFAQNAELYVADTLIACTAKISLRNDEKSLVIEKIKKI
jgi:DNA polymerase-3 subunit alpha